MNALGSIVNRVTSVIRRHTLMAENDTVIVAVSGGADSLALLHILNSIDLPLQLMAVYIDHGLRPQETPQEQKIIAECCHRLNIPFKVRAVNVHKLVAGGKHSPEEAARILRYTALEEIMQEYNAPSIAVGHTSDDQVEEFFIRLIRGSSVRGLTGMSIKRDCIVRPLLFEKKADLVDYLAILGQPWCLDSSNLDKQFLRNRVRLDLLPLLEETFNPALRKTILQSMDVLAEENTFLDEQTAGAYAACTVFSESSTKTDKRTQLIIQKEPFLVNHRAIQRRILEKSCWQMRIRPTYEHICTLAEFIKNGRPGSELHLEDGVRAEKSSHHLRLLRPLPKGCIRGSKQPAAVISQTVTGPGRFVVTGTNKELTLEETTIAAGKKEAEELRVDLAKISWPMQLRSFLPGEKFYPCGGHGSKKISRYFNEKKIPAKERQGWPVLVSDGKIVALVGLQLDHNFRISDSTSSVLTIGWKDLTKNSTSQ